MLLGLDVLRIATEHYSNAQVLSSKNSQQLQSSNCAEKWISNVLPQTKVCISVSCTFEFGEDRNPRIYVLWKLASVDLLNCSDMLLALGDRVLGAPKSG